MLTEKSRTTLWWILLFLLIVRIACSIVVPLTDTTEARYGEIARKMLETGDWITPQHDYGVPFWAKPPLSTWLSAFSMKLFGVNEFAARLPSLLVGIAMLMLVWQWTAARRGRDFALVTVSVLASMSLFFMAGGAVMTDSSLALCTTLTMISFWQALQTSSRGWGYLFFVGLGFGLLAKGPLVGVLTFLPILPWIIFRKNWLQVWRALPWVSGTLLMLLIGVPWYLIAEHKTPGFLAYFILGEHFGRFLNPGWDGDKYGHAHAEPIGMIWVFWLAAALPWSFVFLAKAKTLIQQRREWLRDATGDDSGLISYLLWWSFAPIVFFTFAHNVIWPYPLPSLAAFAVLLAEIFARFGTRPLRTPLLLLTLFTPVVLLGVAALYAADRETLLKSSQKDTAQFYLQQRSSSDDGLFYYRRRYYSGEFYSAGKAKMLERGQTPTLLANTTHDFLVMYKDEVSELPAEVQARFKPLREFGDFVVMEEITPHS